MPATFIILPVHNRREITSRCLAHLRKIGVLDWARIIVVDDGSTDSTADAVRNGFPEATVLSGDGNLWWGGAIRLGMEHAVQCDADCLVWLNDDCLPADNTLRLLVDHAANTHGIAAGWSQTPSGGWYGGFRKTRRGLEAVPATGPDSVQACDATAGNCVAIAREVVTAIGLPDATRLPHALLDVDYTLDATRYGFPLDLLGSAICRNDDNLHPASSSWLLSEQSPMRQWRLFLRPQSIYGFRAYFHLSWKHWRLRGLWLFLRVYLKLMVVCALRLLIPVRWLRALYTTRSPAWRRQQFHAQAATKNIKA